MGRVSDGFSFPFPSASSQNLLIPNLKLCRQFFPFIYLPVHFSCSQTSKTFWFRGGKVFAKLINEIYI